MAYEIGAFTGKPIIAATTPKVVHEPSLKRETIDPDAIGDWLAKWFGMFYEGWRPYLSDECVWLEFRKITGEMQPLIFKRSLLDGDFDALLAGLETLIRESEKAREAKHLALRE